MVEVCTQEVCTQEVCTAWISSGGNGMPLELLTVRSIFLWLAEGACWLPKGEELGGL